MFKKLHLSAATESAVREFIRVIVLAVIPVAIATLTLPEWTWNGFIVAAVVAALKATDKYLHKVGSKAQLPF